MVEQNGQQLPFDAVKRKNWTLADKRTVSLIEKMESSYKTLSEYLDGNIYFGIKTGFNKAFVIDEQQRDKLIRQDPASAEIIKPLIVGNDVRKWQANYKDKWLIVTYLGVDISRYPAIFDHLSQWQRKLETRQDQGNHWWELRPCTYYAELDKPKIIYPDIAKESRFAFDSTGLYCTNTTYFFPSNDLFLLGLLNSGAMWKYASEKLTVLGDANKGGRLRFFTQFVTNLPIPKVDNEQKRKIRSKVEQILEAKQTDPAAYVSALEQEIDQLVYELYRLTPAEIALIEGRELSEEERPQSPRPTTEAVGSNRFSGSRQRPAAPLYRPAPPGQLQRKNEADRDAHQTGRSRRHPGTGGRPERRQRHHPLAGRRRPAHHRRAAGGRGAASLHRPQRRPDGPASGQGCSGEAGYLNLGMEFPG
jgi:hypothetical protein